MYKPFEETLSFDDVLLVPQYSEILSRKEVFLGTRLSKKTRLILDIPIISANMDTVTESKMAILMARMGGLGIIHRFLDVKEQVAEVKKVKAQNLIVGAAVGVKEGELERAHALVDAGADVLTLDIAHGHSKYAMEKVRYFRKQFPKLFIIAGNVATAEGFRDLAEAGADAVKVGIGAGSICITRVITGFGIPQMSAVLECAPIAEKMGVGLISDGGIKNSGDIVKAMAAGADAVMVGNILAGTDEAPGEVVELHGKKYKTYRGMASLQANLNWPGRNKKQDEIVEEGVQGYVPYKGPAENVVKKMIGGMRSGFSYSGARNIKELHAKAKIVRITAAGLRESNPHDIYLNGNGG